jgi:acyl-coenzyme A synthetase/AMP-(fatty) acid ligase
MQLILWKELHSFELYQDVQDAWKEKKLVILCPENLDRFDYFKWLPKGEVTLKGAGWTKRPSLADLGSKSSGYEGKDRPILGVFTSGTSSEPKLVLYSKKNIESAARSIYSLYDQSRIRKIFCYPQPVHTFGLTLGYVSSIIFGWTLVFSEGKYGEKAHELWIKNADLSMLTLGVPTHFLDLKAYLERKQITPPATYSAILGGAPVSQRTWDWMRNELRIEQPSTGYGATEASPGITHLPPGLRPVEDGDIGYPLKHLSAAIVEGEGVKFSGPSVCLAVIDTQRIVFPTSYQVSDAVEKGPLGRWIYRGRVDNVLNRGGLKYQLEALETRVQTELGISVICSAVAHPRLGSELGILMACPEAVFQEQKRKIYELLRARCKTRFDDQFCVRVDALPRNSNAKLDRKTAKQLLNAIKKAA